MLSKIFSDISILSTYTYNSCTHLYFFWKSNKIFLFDNVDRMFLRILPIHQRGWSNMISRPKVRSYLNSPKEDKLRPNGIRAQLTENLKNTHWKVKFWEVSNFFKSSTMTILNVLSLLWYWYMCGRLGKPQLWRDFSKMS